MKEKQIVERILKGDEKTLLVFYRHFQKSLASYIRKKVENEADVEEILQDTLFATLEGLRDFSFRSSLFTFICSIANHKVIDFYRRKKIRKIFFSASTEVEMLLSTLFGPEDQLSDQLLRQKIEETFRKIAPRYEKVLKLKYIYGYSVSEVAGKLSISFKSAESQLFRARKAFVEAYS